MPRQALFQTFLGATRRGCRLQSGRKQEAQEAEMDEIDTLIREFILREFLPGEDPIELSAHTRLITGGILDSISTLKLVTFLEDHFDITVEAYEAGINHLDTIHQIAALVASTKNAA
jgi:acyl carrier protein